MSYLVRLQTESGPRTVVQRHLDLATREHLASHGAEIFEVDHPGRQTVRELVAARDKALDREIKAIVKRKAKTAIVVGNVHQLRRKS